MNRASNALNTSALFCSGEILVVLMVSAVLLLTHFGFDRDVAEALALTGDEGRKIGDRSTGGLDATPRQLLRHLRRFQRGLQLGIHPVDDRLRRASRRQ